MKIRAALLCVLALALLGTIATATEPTPATGTPAVHLPAAPPVAWPASITPLPKAGCGAATFALPKMSNVTPAAVAATLPLCGSCSDFGCKGNIVNNSCGTGKTCFAYSDCSDNSIYCVCSGIDP
jgi:hypothetical protein